jgi:hypothetical protein
MKRCCIIYWGLIRGFKHDLVYESHKKNLYKYLEDNNIEYDIYIVTNDNDYDDTQLNKLENVKKISILKLDEINKLEIYNNLINNFNFHSHFQPISKTYLAYCYYNRKYIMDFIPDSYDFYISLDIQHYIEKFNFLNDYNNNVCIMSNYHKQMGVNPRVFIANYKYTKLYNNITDYALKGNYHHNPESLLKKYLEINNIPIMESNNILIHRVRHCGTMLRDDN